MVKTNKFQCFITLILILHVVNYGNTVDNQKEQFILNNDACKMERQDPWLLRRFYFNKSYVPCKQKRPFTIFERVDNTIYAILDVFRIDLYRSRSIEITCCISNITRVISANVPDNKVQVSRCVPFDDRGRAMVKSPVIKISCYKVQNNRNILAYENVYAFHLYNDDTRYTSANISSSHVTFNVLLIGVGSMSRQNVLRTWPQTHGYLSKAGWYNFEGYSRVGENTISNMLPILSGYSEKQAEKSFRSPWGDFYDNYDFIWSDFQNRGYVTSFAEDHTRYAIFNKHRSGFITPPTDFYFRTYAVASDNLQTSLLDRMPHCIGNQNAAERIFNLAIDLVKTCDKRPYFGLFWFNTFSAEDLNAPSRMDRKMMEFLKGLEPYVKNTFVVFFSDHGFNKFNITRFKNARSEAQRPFLYIYVPENFRRSFGKECENVEMNTKRLTSPYDLHVTLLDILRISDGDRQDVHATSCKKCESFLRSISATRSCANAGVEDQFCLCFREKPVVLPTPIYVKEEQIITNNGNLRKKLNICALIVFAVVCNIIIEKVL